MKRVIVVLVAMAALFVLNVMRTQEMYCSFYPSIDTQYAPGYSERAFSAIQAGDTSESVKKALGTPFAYLPAGDGVSVWYYTMDGKCREWGDFAWLLRTVWISNDVVLKTEKRIIRN